MSVMEGPLVVSEDLCLAPDELEQRGKPPQEDPYVMLSRELGIGRHARPHVESTRPSSNEAAKFFPEWTGFQLEAWSAYLPTHYWLAWLDLLVDPVDATHKTTGLLEMLP